MDQRIKVVTQRASKVEIFDSLEMAQRVYPDLDPSKNGERFTWGMTDGNFIRFEDWSTQEKLSC